MNKTDAFKILGLSGSVTPRDIKAAYKAAIVKYHPDVNPAGVEMAKMINAAYAVVRDFKGVVPSDDDVRGSYPQEVNDALQAIIGLVGLDIEICGSWVWVTGNTRTHKDVLKAAGFRYSGQKKAWYFKPVGWKRKSRRNVSLNEIRGIFGSSRPVVREREKLAASA